MGMTGVPNFASLFEPGGAGGSSMGGPTNLNFGGGSNQYMSYPSMGGGQSGYAIPQNSMSYNNLNPFLYGNNQGYGQVGQTGYPMPGAPQYQSNAGQGGSIPGGMKTGPTVDPALTGALGGYLQSQIGQGLPGFQGSVQLPSTGQMTSPGQLTAGENPLMQQLQQFFMGQGSGVTGEASGAGGTSNSPLSYVLPMWQSEMSSMNLPIQQQLANLKEQFGSRGALGSSEMANSMQDYLSQTAADQENMLGQLTLSALPQEMGMAGGIQNLDQSAIDRAYSQFQTDLPQNNPLLQEQYGMATSYPPIYQPKGSWLDALLGSSGSIMKGAAALGGHF